MINFPIIVTGPPYSGTSVIARLLQTKFDVMMDEGPLRTDEHKPFGYYEDHKILEINKIAFDYCMNRVGTKNQKVPIQWATGFAEWLSYRNNKYNKWGWKDPGCVGLIRFMHQFFNDPIWIVCNRKDEQIIKSQVEKEGYPEKIAIKGLWAYKEIIKKELDGKCHYVNLSTYTPESILSKKLGDIINGRN